MVTKSNRTRQLTPVGLLAEPLPCTPSRREQNWAIKENPEMLVHVITDNHLHIRSREELAGEVESSVQSALSRFASQITRVEVHLSDENAQKGGDHDKKCTVEARVAGLQAIAA